MVTSNSLGLLIFGGVALVAQILVMLIRKRGFGPQSTRLFGLTVIVTIAAFLVVTEVEQDRIGAALGMLGTVAGYLLGKTDAKAND